MFSATINKKMEDRRDILEGIIGETNEEEKEEIKNQLDVFNLNVDIRHTIKGLDQKFLLVHESSKEIHLVHFLKNMMNNDQGVRS
jgi:hypothetical protein